MKIVNDEDSGEWEEKCKIPDSLVSLGCPSGLRCVVVSCNACPYHMYTCTHVPGVKSESYMVVLKFFSFEVAG
jgi:hypothetical protein